MKTELVQIYHGYIKAEKPLPLPLYNQEGRLMAEKGMILSHEKVVDILTNPRILTPKSELIEALDRFKLESYRVDSVDDDYAFQLTGTVDALHRMEKEFLALVADNESGFEKKMHALAKRLNALTERNPDACLASIFLRTTRSSIIAVSFATAIIGAILTREMYWAEKERITFICAALTLEISNLIEYEGDGLFDLEPDMSKINGIAHIKPSIEMLKGKGVEHRKWFSYILTHHAYDPKSDNREQGNIELGLAMSLMNLVHHYCSMVTGYGYEQVVLPDVATAYIFGNQEQRYQKYFARIFSRFVGKYPAGTIVTLANKITAIVVRQGVDMLYPYISILRHADGGEAKAHKALHTDSHTNKISNTLFDVRLVRQVNFASLWR